MIWRRDKSSAAGGSTQDSTEETVGGKGRPTPSRKQVEAERRERLQATARGTNRSRAADAAAARAAAKSGKGASNREIRQRVVAGDERVLTARDRGPERRLARDLVDRRHTIGEYFLFLAIFVLVVGLVQTPVTQLVSQLLLPIIVIALIVDSIRIYRGVGAAVREQFPNGNTGGIGRYAMMRGMVTRRMRVPAPQVERPRLLRRG